MAKRGYTVTGIDLSESQLKRAHEKSKEAGVNIKFDRGDARSLKLTNQYDVALIICEGGFALMETDEMNFAILQGAGKALNSGGTFIMTTLNALFPLAHSIEEFMNSSTVERASSGHKFDTITLRDMSTFKFTDDDSQVHTLHCNERYYMPSEITWMMKSLHFIGIEIFGCQAGNFSRSMSLTPNNFEMLVIAKTV
jgi:SAM-dependent methyltransferase